MQGVLLDPKTGRPEGDPPGLADVPSKGVVMNYLSPEVDGERMLHRAPDHVKANLAKASKDSAFNPRGSMQAWEEVLYVPLADGATVTAAAEALFFPIFTLPANYLYPGRLMKWTVMGRLSSAITTPGTFTLRLAYSATGLGAVVVCASGAFAPDPTAAATNLTFMSTWWCVCRSSGTAGTVMGWGKTEWTDYDDASLAALVANMGMDMSPQSAPATAAVDTTVARALSPTYQPSVATASMTAHAGFLEAMT
jgi:hypothetical protein